MNDPLPKTPDEAKLLEPSIARLLAEVPEKWAVLNQNDLTASEQRALLLLTAAGMIERRIAMKIISVVGSFLAEIEFSATGEYGMVEALQPVLAQMWAKNGSAYAKWSETHGACPPSHCEVLHESWRLTNHGALARHALDKTAHDREFVFAFILRKWPLESRPPVRGAGHLVKFTHSGEPVSTDVLIQNWSEGAKSFAQEFFKMFGEPVPTDTDRDSIVAKVLAEDYAVVAEIVATNGLSLDEKMSRIAIVDSVATGWDSVKWGEILGVTAGRIRQTTAWQKWRKTDQKR